MNTEQLIQAMAADTETTAPPDGILPAALALTAAVTGGIYLIYAGIRPDLSVALGHTDVLVKHIFPLLLAVGGLLTVLRLARPGESPRGPGYPLLVAVPVLVGLAFVVTAAQTPVANWGMAITGKSLATCLTFIPLISLPVAFVCLWVLRRGASTHPGLTGAVAGMMSGGAGATLYAFYCTDDSPMFFGVWYVVAIGIVTLISFYAGRRLLSW